MQNGGIEAENLLGDCAIRDANEHVFFSAPNGCVLEAPKLVCWEFHPLLAQMLRGRAEGVARELLDKAGQPPSREGVEVEAVDSVAQDSKW